MHIMLAEDDTILADALSVQLKDAGHSVKLATNGPVAEYLLDSESFDLAILDLGLPMMDGLTVLRKVRTRDLKLPVVILTAQDGLDTRVDGFNSGADDYIIKPFDFPELEARLRALLRRASAGAASAEVVVGHLVFDPKARRATVNGAPIDFSPRELTLLDLLVAKRDDVVTKDEVITAWANDSGGAATGNAIEVYIHRLRKRLDGAGVDIRTVRGLGYMLTADGKQDSRPA